MQVLYVLFEWLLVWFVMLLSYYFILWESENLATILPLKFKSYYDPGTKVFWRIYTEIHRHLHWKCSKNSGLGHQEMVQCKCFLWHKTDIFFAEKFVKWERFLAVLHEHIIFNVKWVEARKMSEVFWARLRLKKTLIMSTRTCGRIWKVVYLK